MLVAGLVSSVRTLGATPASPAPASPAAGGARSLLLPPLRRDFTRAYATLRPFVNLLGPGGGGVGELGVERYLRAPLKLSLEITPVALAISGGAVGLIAHVRGGVALATDYIEFGLAAGTRAQNFGPGGLSFAAGLRLGALDGLNLTARYGYVLFRNHYDGRLRLALSNGTAAIEAPLAPGLTALLDAGLSLDIWAYVTLGLRHRLRGDGGPGTWFLRGGLGFGWVLDRFPCQYGDPAPCENAAWAMGPALLIGAERRF